MCIRDRIYKFESVFYLVVYVFFALAAYFQAESDILGYVHVRKKGVFLKDRVYLPFVWRQIGYILSLKHYFACVRFFKTAQYSQSRCV